MNKLVPMILFYLESGEKPRHKVTNKIRNYPKDMRESAISYVLSNGLVSLREELSPSKRGRTPSFIFLTEKGKKECKGLSRTPRHDSVWGV